MSNEMKQKNEEILMRWRNLGFLNGLKEGSINEWRCAKSFDNMANWIMSQPNDCGYALTILTFPMIRKVLCTGKNRLYRIIDAETIVDCFKNDTVRDCFEIINKTKTEKTRKMVRVLESFITLVDGWDMSIETFMQEIASPEKSSNPLMKSVCIVNSIMDTEAEMMCAISEQFKTHFADRLSDVLTIGDEFETDKGEKMKVIDFNDDGEIIAENV